MKTPLPIFLATLLLAMIGSRTVIAAPPQPASAATGTNAFAFDFPKSVFVVPTNADQGLHDPFYPTSGRLWVVATPTVSTGAAPVSVLPPLAVTALSGGGKVDWIASINGNPFKEGEDGTVSTPSGRVKIRCLKIDEKSVTVEVNGHQIELPCKSNR